MIIKLDIGTKSGKTYHIELDEEKSEIFIGKKLKDIIKGEDFNSKFSGFEFQITGMSDKQGFPGLNFVKGPVTKKILLKKGKGMKQKKPRGVRVRKSIHGDTINKEIIQINLKAIKEPKPFGEILEKENKKDNKDNKETTSS